MEHSKNYTDRLAALPGGDRRLLKSMASVALVALVIGVLAGLRAGAFPSLQDSGEALKTALTDGRSHVACEDLRSVLLPALRHRLILNFEGEAQNIETDVVLADVLSGVRELAAVASA